MLQFPSSPSLNQTYAGWTWDGAKWIRGGGGGVTVAPTAPASPSVGQLWFNTSNNHLMTYLGSGPGGGWQDAGGGAGMGVTNGSSAAIGEVGEVVTAITASGSGLALGSGAVGLVLCSAVLTAGDWDLDGTVSMLTGSNTQNFDWRPAGLAPTVPANMGNPGMYPLTPVAVSLATTTTIQIVLTQSGGSGQGRGAIRARRRR